MSGLVASTWLRPAGAPASARYTLVCLPYAGGGSAVFRPWQRHTRLLAVVGVHLPGREIRLREPAFERMDALADALSEVVAGVRGPLALFGHSMGGLLAFEVARRIRDTVGNRLRALFIGACRPPQTAPAVRASELPAPQLVAHLVRLGGLPPEVALDREAIDFMLPFLRADLATVDTYRYREAEPLPYPIHVLCGTHDANCGPAQAEGWARHTSAGLSVEVVKGDHFFAFREPRQTVTTIERTLRGTT